MLLESADPLLVDAFIMLLAAQKLLMSYDYWKLLIPNVIDVPGMVRLFFNVRDGANSVISSGKELWKKKSRIQYVGEIQLHHPLNTRTPLRSA